MRSRVIVVLPFHSLADDVGTVKRAIELVGSPTIVAGHSYGGMVITDIWRYYISYVSGNMKDRCIFLE